MRSLTVLVLFILKDLGCVSVIDDADFSSLVLINLLILWFILNDLGCVSVTDDVAH